ncbi:MAG: hypothetical protein ACYDEQ_09015 [Desulfocucumaceae bacterium]
MCQTANGTGPNPTGAIAELRAMPVDLQDISLRPEPADIGQNKCGASSSRVILI